MIGALVAAFGLLLGQPAPPTAAPPSQPDLQAQPTEATGAPAQWTLSFPATYCGGPRIGGYVQLSFDQPLAVPASVPPGSVQLANQAADVSVIDPQTIQIAFSRGLIWAQYCTATPQTFTAVIGPDAGLNAPSAAGDYTVEFSTGASPAPQTLTVTFTDPASADAASGG